MTTGIYNDDDSDHWPCLIKLSSPFLLIWEILVSLLLLYLLLFLPLSIASREMKIFVQYNLNSRIWPMVFAMIMVFDVLFNFVSEHELREQKQTRNIRESALHYTSKASFYFDLLSSIFVCAIAFCPTEYFLDSYLKHLYWVLFQS